MVDGVNPDQPQPGVFKVDDDVHRDRHNGCERERMGPTARVVAGPMVYPARSALDSTSTLSRAKMTVGWWIWAAMVRVVVMSIIAFSDGSSSIVAG